MSLVDFKALEESIELEHTEINIKETARNLIGLKQLMGPVTSVWSDFVLESVKISELTLRERKILVREMEKDIRRAVKKDKTEIVYGAIVAFGALKQAQLREFAENYVKRLGMNLERYVQYLNMISTVEEKVIRGFQIVYFNTDVYPVFSKLQPALQINTFQRASKRPVNFIAQRLEKYTSLFKSLIGRGY